MAGLMETPKGSINFVPAKAGETLALGHITIRIMEDGSRTGTTQSLPSPSPLSPSPHLPLLTHQPDNRIGSAEFTVPAHTPGPPPHWHEMV